MAPSILVLPELLLTPLVVGPFTHRVPWSLDFGGLLWLMTHKRRLDI